VKNLVKKVLGKSLASKLKKVSDGIKQNKIRECPFTIDDLVYVLGDVFRIKTGDTLFVHSAVGDIMRGVPVNSIIEILMEMVGPQGTIMMPSYPKLPSYRFLKSGELWDVERTPSYTGLLTEIFRRDDNTKRSLHPTKSVAVWGRLRDELISEHHKDIRPYSANSPYFKLKECRGKAIGIGVSAHYLSFVHTIDDYLGHKFPVDVYHKELFNGRVLTYEGNEIIVQTLAHNLDKMKFDIVGFTKKYIPKEQGCSFKYKFRDFFVMDTKNFFETGINLAKKNITIYRKSVYKKNRI
jgi:aminoglycoside 3-N-acetyltransferase